ncbi:hypothetical protein THIOSC15_1480003 [uncultured Thiomicrorhabdus sp.]
MPLVNHQNQPTRIEAIFDALAHGQLNKTAALTFSFHADSEEDPLESEHSL